MKNKNNNRKKIYHKLQMTILKMKKVKMKEKQPIRE